MSTDIKPGCDSPGCFDHPATPDPSGLAIFQVGDTVRVLPTECDPKNGLHPNALVTVEHADETHVRVSGSSLEYFARRFELVKRADDAPAPIDPSKVAITLKVGDYIEAESDGTKIGGPVSHVNENGFVSIQHLGSFAIEGITPPRTGYREFALTAHQPAPEPEPEWKPGTVAVVVQGGDPGAGVDDHEFRAALQTDGTWVGLAGEAATAAPVSVRPLVVLSEEESRAWRQWKDS